METIKTGGGEKREKVSGAEGRKEYRVKRGGGEDFLYSGNRHSIRVLVIRRAGLVAFNLSVFPAWGEEGRI